MNNNASRLLLGIDLGIKISLLHHLSKWRLDILKSFGYSLFQQKTQPTESNCVNKQLYMYIMEESNIWSAH